MKIYVREGDEQIGDTFRYMLKSVKFGCDIYYFEGDKILVARRGMKIGDLLMAYLGMESRATFRMEAQDDLREFKNLLEAAIAILDERGSDAKLEDEFRIIISSARTKHYRLFGTRPVHLVVNYITGTRSLRKEIA